MTIRVLLQTTIVPSRNDWSIARLELLTKFLREQTDDAGKPLFAVTARDRDRHEPSIQCSRRSIEATSTRSAVRRRHGQRPAAGGVRLDLRVPSQRRRSAGHAGSHGSRQLDL